MYEVQDKQEQLVWRQRWAHYLTVILAFVLFVSGINMRESVLNAVVPYSNTQAGITGFYPANWLLDTAGDYVFRVRDITNPGFKTTIQVSVLPVSEDTAAQNVFNSLTINRAQVLSNYTVLRIEPYTLLDDVRASAMSYTFVSRETGASLESLPSVVAGFDILTIQRGQAIVITFQADRTIYNREFRLFEQFLNTLEF